MRISDWSSDVCSSDLLRVLWQPRVLRAVQWAAEQLGSDMADGWLPVAVEARGERTLAGVALNGRADRIDARDGALRIVDYKTGKPPSTRQLKAGFALQLGLLGWLADPGAFDPVTGRSEEHTSDLQSLMR